MTQKSCSLKVGEGVIEYAVNRSRQRRKTMGILVHPERGVVVMVPHNTSETQVTDFVENKRRWIAEKLSALDAAKLPPRQFTADELFKFLGRDYPLDLRVTTRNDNRVRLVKDRLIVWVPHTDFLTNLQEQRIKDSLERWYMAKAEKELTRITREFVKRSGLKPSAISIKKLKTNWGQCKGSAISLCWRLVMAPIPLIEYVVVHELCHLEHKNHSKIFWSALSAIMPDYKEREEQLKTIGPELRL